jgi:hypothetical protein
VLPALAQKVEVDFMKQLLHRGDDAQSVLGLAVDAVDRLLASMRHVLHQAG